jgi:hypothetical protein
MVDREYWVRLDGRSVKLEHYVIRDMMLRHALPELQFYVVSRRQEEVFDGREEALDRQVSIDFRILNMGRAVAKHAGWFASIQNAKLISARECNDLSSVNHGRLTVAWDAQVGSVLHPNGIHNHAGSLVLEFLDTNAPIAMLAKIYCEDMVARDITFIIKYPTPDRPITRIGT